MIRYNKGPVDISPMQHSRVIIKWSDIIKPHPGEERTGKDERKWIKYSVEYKADVLKLADEIGTPRYWP